MRLSNIIQSVLSVAALSNIAIAADSNSTSNSTAPITIDGNAFYNSATKERFYIRGVDYQPGGSSNLTDPLADADICGRDVPVFKDLGINTVRVYTVDNSLDHTECMKLLSDAGIYLILDVNTPTSAISRLNPSCSYNADYLQNVFATIDTFATYDNVLGFFAGNEVINSDNTTNTATYVKAVVRDMKKYIKARNYRTIPVGYSAADIVANRALSAQYFNCGDDADARIDMFGVNDYSWCGPSSFGVSGYATKMQLYKNYSIPIFLSEFGCNKVVSNRPFTEIESIYSTQMSSVFSGGLVYEYSNETNNYGLVKIDSDGTSVTKLTDYENLKSEYAKVSNPTGDGGAYAGNDYSTCPDYEKDTWEANNTLPDMPTAASAYFKSGAGEPMGTFISTQNSCHDDDDDDIVSLSSVASSSSSTVESSSSSEAESTSTSSTTTMSSSTVASSTSSSSSKSSKSKHSKGAAGTLEIPAIFQLLSQTFGYIL
ncbi:similar to Saccharomyces cerevisiae YOL030W GAS5 1,3-beta-glucanosyltransferase, has similarity to Gas1p [Maudiozyma barnettii]|nr:similar to Saccharomyces cerevisiae YOL030W GAS5 1,3-beta-glucanosyltransferase, has similarity to Gas1p [Kazachstania barnettii]